MDKRQAAQTEDSREDIIAGRNAVGEALRAGRPLDSVLIARGERSGSLGALAADCRRRGIPVKETDARRLDALCGPSHQGIAAVAACKETVSLDDLFRAAEEKGEPPFFVVCDGWRIRTTSAPSSARRRRQGRTAWSSPSGGASG